MAGDSSIRSFKCPTCGAPLEPESGKSTMKCPYCGDTVVIPKSLRIKAPAPAPAPKAQYASSRSDNAPSRRATRVSQSSSAQQKPGINIGGIITAVVVVALIAVAYFTFGASMISSMLFAHQVLSFGSQGTGQGMFQNARAIGVDGSGNIVVADNSDGRVQVFGPDGKFISLFRITDKSLINYIQAMAVSHDGKIYLPGANGILIYDEKGQMLGQVSTPGINHSDLTLGTDGTLYVLSNRDDIVRLKSDGSIDLQIPKAVSTISGQVAGNTRLAVDGLGNMYVVDDTAKTVFKYSPDGKFINQFGEPFQSDCSGENCNTFKPGTFYSPNGIAVDGYGRIFVSDFDATQVYDSSGKYLNYLSGGFDNIALDQQGNLYGINAYHNNVAEYQIQKP